MVAAPGARLKRVSSQIPFKSHYKGGFAQMGASVFVVFSVEPLVLQLILLTKSSGSEVICCNS